MHLWSFVHSKPNGTSCNVGKLGSQHLTRRDPLPLTTRSVAVTGGGSVGERGILSQPCWLFGAL